MNRRTAVTRIGWLAGGSVALFSGVKVFSLFKPADITYLKEKIPLLSALAETIIPATDTPGAKEAGVGNFIYVMIKDCTEKRSANNFINGLKDLERHCDSQYNCSFINCNEQQQIKTLAYFEEKGKPYDGIAGKIQNKLTGKSFFSSLKTELLPGLQFQHHYNRW